MLDQLDGVTSVLNRAERHELQPRYRDSLFLSHYLAGIMKLDHNPAVYGQTRIWATYLRGEQGVLDPLDTILTYGELVPFTADRAIDDAARLADPREDKTGSKAEIDGSSTHEPALFEVEP